MKRRAAPSTAGSNKRFALSVTLINTVFLSLSGLLVAFAVSWLVLAQVNFSYPLWHDHAGIGEAIERYGGENRFKTGFDLTTREQRIDLFAGINKAIHRNGEGLDRLVYQVPGEPVQQLLRDPEIVHLQDVANLLNIGFYAAIIALVLWLLAIGLWVRSAKPFPSLLSQLAGIISLLGVGALVILAIGPVDVFNALHVWVFPDGHQWFFYYQESLMSTMMYAPVLFGWIALEWVALAVLVFVLLQLMAASVVRSARGALRKS